MEIINALPNIIKNGNETFKRIANEDYGNLSMKRYKIMPKKGENENSFYQGDNLIIMGKLLQEGYGGKFDLIYIDPPFLTNVNYRAKVLVENGDKIETIEYLAYRDIWNGGMVQYLEELYIRLILMRELLSSQGTIYVHLDSRTVHYVKILMDGVFGEENFLNEIIWAYKSGGSSPRHYAKKHDNILVFTKTKDYIFNPQLEKSYNRNFKPYGFRNVEEFQDEIGWYTMVRLKDVWSIDMVGRTSSERLSYSTQKPGKLLERIILTSSNENSLVGDFFAGSGTTGAVAEKNNRKWIMADKGNLSKTTINKRLIENEAYPYTICEIGDPRPVGKLFIEEMGIIEIDKDLELNLKLNKYQLNTKEISMTKKYKEIIYEILEYNSLALLDFIGIDINYNGDTPNLDWQYIRTDDNLKIDKNIRIRSSNLGNTGMIFIKTMDIFGNTTEEIIKI